MSGSRTAADFRSHDSHGEVQAHDPGAVPVTKVLIVIVNYRTAGLVVDCLASLEPEVRRLPGASVIVTDNDSGDDSIRVLNDAIRDRGWERWAKVRPLGRNGGFAFGNNGAIAPALESPDRPRYLWMLNPDTLVRPGGLAELVGFLEANPGVGLVGSRLEEPDGTRQLSAFRFPSILGELDAGASFWPLHAVLGRWTEHPPVGERPRQVDWVSGASLMARAEVFDAIGALDEDFFMYYEEVDFCFRALRAGWPCWYVPASRVVHLIGQSSGVFSPDQAKRRMPPYWFESRRRYFLRNHGRFRTLLADLAWATGALSFRARNLIQRKPVNTPENYLRDFIRHGFLAPRSR